VNNPEEEVQQILDDMSKFKSKDGGILADMVHKYSNKFYEIVILVQSGSNMQLGFLNLTMS
jgi:hypothetical protein